MWVSPPELTEKIVKHYNQDFDLPNVSSGAKASVIGKIQDDKNYVCLLYTSPSPRDLSTSRMPSSA